MGLGRSPGMSWGTGDVPAREGILTSLVTLATLSTPS